MTRLNTLNRAAVAVAEERTDTLAQLSARLEGISWELDAALSAIRKDDAGYRTANAANREGGANYTPGELEEASRRASEALIALAPFVQLLDKWDAEDAAGGPENVVHLDFARLHNERRPSLWSRLFSWSWSDVADVAA